MLPVIVLCINIFHAYADPAWKLKKDEDGIKVYTAECDTSKFKSVKVECTVNAKMSQLVALLLDVSKQPDWVYGTKSSHLLRKIKDNEVVFYSEVSVPWPCTNRDYIAHITINEASPQHVTIDSHAEPGVLPTKPDRVRVRSSVAHWDISAAGANALKIVYTVQFDPSGAVPAWLVNMFLTKGPLQTFQKLRQEVVSPAYSNVHVDFLKDQG